MQHPGTDMEEEGGQQHNPSAEEANTSPLGNRNNPYPACGAHCTAYFPSGRREVSQGGLAISLNARPMVKGPAHVSGFLLLSVLVSTVHGQGPKPGGTYRLAAT